MQSEAYGSPRALSRGPTPHTISSTLHSCVPQEPREQIGSERMIGGAASETSRLPAISVLTFLPLPKSVANRGGSVLIKRRHDTCEQGKRVETGPRTEET